MLESYIKDKAEEFINGYKNGCESRGAELTERDIMFLKMGIAYGMTISSFTLIEASKVLDEVVHET